MSEPMEPSTSEPHTSKPGIADSERAASVRVALAQVIDPEIRRPITELDMVGDITASEAHATVHIKLTIVGCPAARRIENDTRAAAETVMGAGNVTVNVGVMTPSERKALIERLRGGKSRGIPFTAESLTRVYAITSGKGGVGKSSVTANLAVALAARGLHVGLIDADVFGFSIPGLLGIDGEKPTQVGDMIMPPIVHGVRVISIGMFVEDSSVAVAWRGPMLHRTIEQFLSDVYFGDLDVLLLDLPPGTGDIAITVGQLLPHAEVIVVTTPQPAAAEVAERSGQVARQTGQSVYGVVENMAGLAQPDGSVLELFGSGGGEELAKRLSKGQDAAVPVIARIPLSIALREGGDTGEPVVLAHPDDPAAQAILTLAEQLATRARGLSGRSLGLSPS